MADTVTTKYLHPPNWDGNFPDDQSHGYKRVIARFTNVSDGTGEVNVRKIRLADWRCSNGAVPTRSVVEWIQYNMAGMGVKIEWDRSPPSMIGIVHGGSFTAGSGTIDFTEVGGGLVDDGEAGDGTGDILFTTLLHTAGDSYDITMSLRFKES